MKTRLARFTLAAAAVAALAAPVAPAHAMACAPGEVETVCNAVFGTWGAVCAKIPEGGKYPIHELVCPQLG
ncbi:MAG TPA: hypothetical protein VFQ85_10540 [Mycobacteriales bacterium]|jgi:hypothetical protein|nr:hypothetical protein [Mycobacteriales bacterium]